ncbi:cytochrome c-type biogenesis protein [Desulfitispora alkaliphila]|uniref:cytochrome c biogenesis CcdA family protein n=1 Tax=Desulfitispora alkaliphila TaxID=622674 RepID=UPI003D1D783A
MIDVFFSEIVPQAIDSKSTLTFLIIFIGGVVTSISPCVLSMIPILMGYIGASDDGSKVKGFFLSLLFVLGLSTTFAILGFIAAYFGSIFGQISTGWYYLLAAVAIIMGLQLLGAITFNMPGLKTMPVRMKGYSGSFGMGMLFGLIASPCATPVLAVIITYVATQGELAYGSSLLFVYGVGHGLPLLAAGTFTALAKNIVKVQRFTQYLNYVSGTALILLGLYLLILASW